MLKRFIAYYKPHRLIFTLDMIAALLVAGVGILYPMITREMLTLLEDGTQKDLHIIIIAGGCALLLIYVIRALLNFFIQYYGHVMGVRMTAAMRRDLFCHLEKLPFRFFDNHETGKLMSRMTNDLNTISELAHHGPENLIISSISIVTSFIYLWNIHPWLTLMIFACVPFLLLITFVLRRKMRSAFQRSRQSVATINASLEGSISGIRVTKAFTNQKAEEEKFEVGNGQFVAAQKDAYRAMGQFHSSTQFVTNVFHVVVLVAGGLVMYFSGFADLSFADYSAFMLSVGLFLTPVTTLINFMEQYQDGVAGFERFIEIIDEEPEKDRPDAIDAGTLRGKIELCNVNYGYGDEKTVLKNVSLTVETGQKYALVGPSGGGKTTICHLIPRFYPVTEGDVRIDGRSINDYTMESLRRNIGIVQQDVYLFNASIRENILYGRPDATEEEVIEAAKRANIHDYVQTLPDGYDTEIGERGVRLSGGQKQRLCIARVFLKNPPILILDEATSALDNTTEILIQQALDELCHGRTTLVVAHRLSTVKNADKIAVISDGRVSELGTHEELLEKNGEYADLYRLQFRGNN